MSDLARTGNRTRSIGNYELPLDSVSVFCKRRNIRKLALFGPVLRGDFGAEGDIDVLVEYKPEHVPGLEFFFHQEELARVLDRQVDLNILWEIVTADLPQPIVALDEAL